MAKKFLKHVIAFGLTVVMALSATPSAQLQAAAPSIEGHGLMGAWYRAKDGGREDIDRFTFEKERYIASVRTGNLNGENLRPQIADLIGSNDDSQFVLARFTGELEIEQEADYTFYMTGDDGFRLYIDGECKIDFWYQKWEQEQKSDAIHLEAGKHDIQVEYLQGWGGAWIKLEWQRDGQDREIIPESVLYQKKESYYQEAADALTMEIEKCERASREVQGSKESMEALANCIKKAQEVRDKDYSNEDIAAVTQQLNQAAEDLKTAKTAVYISTGVQETKRHTQFMNPLYQGQDPFITQKDGFYYLVASSNDDNECKIYVSKSRTLTDQGEKKLVMDLSGKQRRVFAPEMFFLNDEDGGRWYIYYCADVLSYQRDYPKTAEKYQMADGSHVACCLRSKTTDPMGEYEDIGPLYCGENNTIMYANDITVVEYDGSLFAIWGADIGDDKTPGIVEMKTPYSIEDDRSKFPIGVGEGPRALKNAKGELFLTLSEGAYATDGYHLSLLRFTGKGKEELLEKDKWQLTKNVFTSNTNVSGPARASFVKSADGTEDWMAYHSRVYKEVGDNWWRQVNIKKINWKENGEPDFGTPASTNKKYDLPSGDPGQGMQYEAENAILEGGAVAQDLNSNYYGEGYVHVPNTNGASVSFVVNAEEEGDYITGLRYAYGARKDGETTDHPTIQLPSRASMNVSVNGRQVEKIAMDKNSITWSEWFTGTLRLRLNKGVNLITYSVDSGCAGNVCLDMLTMHRADQPYTQTEIVPQTVKLEKDYAVLQEGETVQIKASVLPGNAGNQALSYYSDKEDAAVVDAGGKVTAKKEGKATIYVRAEGNKQASAEFTVCVVKKQENKPGTPGNLEIQNGHVFQSGNLKYKVTNAKKRTVSVTGSAGKKGTSINIKATVKYAGKSYKITAVAKNAFKNNKKLTKAVIGSNVTIIEDNAFYGNTKLKSVTIGKKVQKIGKSAFYKNSSLKKITVKSSGLKSVGKNAFKKIPAKAVIDVPNNKVKAYKKLLKKAGQAKSVTIK